MKKVISAFIAGLVFASGLAISGMTDPRKVIGFLDITGIWMPALMFVMVGAILVYAIANAIIMRLERPIFDSQFHVPQNKRIDKKLLVGAALFGAGWGLGGFCPGPAITAIGAGYSDSAIFFGFMLLGMFVFDKVSS